MSAAAGKMRFPQIRLLRWLSDRKIAVKITSGFVTVLALLGVVSATSYWSFWDVQTSFTEVARLSSEKELAVAIERSFLDLRRGVREFEATGSDAAAREVLELTKKAEQLVLDGEAKISIAARAKRLAEIKAVAQLYVKDANHAIELRRERDGLIKDTIDPVGLKMRALLESIQDTARTAGDTKVMFEATDALQNVMQIRLNVVTYLLSEDASVLDRAKTYRVALSANLKTLDQLTAATAYQASNDEVGVLFANFFMAADRAIEVSPMVRKLIDGDMRQRSKTIADDAAYIRTGVTADEEKTTAGTRAVLHRARRCCSV